MRLYASRIEFLYSLIVSFSTLSTKPNLNINKYDYKHNRLNKKPPRNEMALGENGLTKYEVL